jgi:two-component system CheB/CheR fusion protein
MDDVYSAPDASTFPIVGIGASAGGLEAFSQLLQRLPANTGSAFVLIQHLDRTHPSLLSEALQKATTMPVHECEHGMKVAPNNVYVIAPNTDLAIADGQLLLSARAHAGEGLHLPVDAFLQSLAAERAGHAVGVILSGTGSDGAQGVRAIKAQDGITLAQTPTSARFGGMPQSAIDTGVVDYCLDIPELADELVRLSHHPYVRSNPDPDANANAGNGDAAARGEIFARLRTAFGLDFSEFKPATISRRFARRLALRGVIDLKAYLELLDAEPDEMRALYEDMLIHVTSFFRDPEVFQALRSRVLPDIFAKKAPGSEVRVWVAGCSTGEEVYSIAMTVLECALDFPGARQIQIFGSDVSELAIRRARIGMFTEAAMGGVGEELKRRYFNKVEGGYRANKTLRERCVLARHDLGGDPPFSKLDLICCRNVLIYFSQALQKKVLPLLHYALNQPGYLVLGRSENIAGFGELFSVKDKVNKIFLRNDVASRLRFKPREQVGEPLAPSDPRRLVPAASDPRFAKHLDQLLLTRYSPPGVLISEDMEVLLFRGATGPYLQAAPGQPQYNLINMARGGLVSALSRTIAEAKREQVIVRRAGVEVDQDGPSPLLCDLVVIPFTGIPNNERALFIVLFEPPRREPVVDEIVVHPSEHPPDSPVEPQRVARLEHELATTKGYLHTLVEDHNRANDELGASNEELVSGNEELQSMNEELETAKEELQSSNEELTTLNDELRARNQEVERLATEAHQARGEAERANTAKDDFLATLSHELRTPLSIMLLHSQRLRGGAHLEQPEIQHAGEALERAAWTQVNLINDLLDVSRIVAGKLTLELRRLELAGVVRMALDSVGPLLEAKNLALTLSIEAELAPIWGDGVRVQQIVFNLLTNAIKFTPAGGRVAVEVDKQGDFARVRVTDTGIGIGESFLPHVFARFSQSDTSITRKYGGLGLGLALVRHLVERHGGEALAHSDGVGKGASFSVTLPFASLKVDERLAAAAQQVQPLDRPGKTKQYNALAALRVLFIDDDVGTREAVREVLQYTGACVEVAASAADGAAAMEAFQPDVILCDIAMPGEDGYTFMRKLRARELERSVPTVRIPALALTALASDEDRKRAFAAGFQLHLAKPIDIDRLRDAVLELSKLVTPPAS